MSTAEDAAITALRSTVRLLEDSGLLGAIRDLHREVWAINLDRYEPDELGDTTRSLGQLCHENVTTRAVRRHRHSDLEPPQHHWTIKGLKVTAPSGVLTFEIGSIRIVGMKVPPSEGRTPRWDRFADWDNESNTRFEIAQENSRVLGGYSTPDPGQHELGDFVHDLGRTPGVVCRYLYAWAGELEAPLTSGWLTVPALGGSPFAAVEPLWHDTDDDLPQGTRIRPQGPQGPGFAQRPAAQPSLALRTTPATEGEA